MTKACSYSLDQNNFKIFDNMLEGVSVYEPVYDGKGKIIDFIIRYVNHATITGSGNSCEHYISKRVSKLYGPENLEPHFKMAEEIVATGESKTFKAYLPPLNRYFQVSGFPTPDGLFIMLRADITDQENAEKELKKAYDDLEFKVQERTYELQKANDELKREIEERKRIERELLENEKRYRELLENSFDAVVIHQEGKIISANSAAMKLLGVKTPERFINTPLLDFVHPDCKETVAKRIKEMLGNKAVPPMEEKFLAVDGRSIDVEVLATGFDYKCKHAVQVVFRDISKRKDAEEAIKREAFVASQNAKALKESEEKFRLIFNKADDMISLSEIKENGMPGKYIEVNEVGRERLGYSREELLNMSPTDIIAPDKRVEMSVNASVIAKNGCSNFEIVHTTKAGKRIPVEVNGHAINYKGQRAYLTVSRDITKRKEMEKAIKESEEKFREIFNKANDMITLHEMNENGMPGTFIEVNEVGHKRLGYTSEEFQNMTPIDIVALDKRVEMANNAVDLWTNGYAKFEIVHVAKDGKRIPVEVNTHLSKLKGKKVALGVSRDITERKNAEEKLNELLEKLSNFNEEFEQYTYITAHYIQEHLGTIADLTENLKQEYKDKLDTDITEFMEHVTDESINLKQIILDSLEYAMVSRAEKVFKSIDLEKSLSNILSDLKINDSDIEITHDQLPVVTADSDQIIKVFHSLITNTMEFKKEDEIHKIHISAFKDDENKEYVFSIQNNGTEMDPQCIEHIFTIHHHLYTHKHYDITGIDLSIAKKIIEGHGGRIWVKSEPGMGLTFYFTLPKT